MNQDKIALLKEMYHKYDFTSAEQNLLAEMWEALREKENKHERDSF